MQRYPVTRNEKALQRAKARLAKEMNAVELLRKIRYISSAAHCFLPDYQRRKLKEISKCRVIDPDQVIKQRNQRKLGSNSLPESSDSTSSTELEQPSIAELSMRAEI